MAWDERQSAMLAEMGVRLWPVAAPAAGQPADMGLPPSRPSAREGGEAGASQEETSFLGGAGGGDARGGEFAARAAPFAGMRETPDSLSEVDARRSAVDTMDWPALRAAVAGCTACGLCKSRSNTVFGVGHADAHWMIVGEAPGEQEDRQGEPFVGKAGILLDNMLRALGLGRNAPPEAVTASARGSAQAAAPDDAARQVFIANVLKCRPPLNRNPLPEEMAQCEPFLRRQVALVRPKVILAMGRFAVRALLQSDLPIGKLRGRLHAYEGVPLVVTYHPAYLLRNPADKARAWEDLCLARAALQAVAPARGAGSGG